MDASSFGAYTVCEERAGIGTACHRTPERMIPNEPMSLVMNTAIGTWNGGQSALDNKHWPAKFFVDHVRVWQKEANIGCDPPDFPTKVHIEKNAWMYGEPVQPSGYETCPEVYPPSAHANAVAIKARASAKRAKTEAVTIAGLAKTTTSLLTLGGGAAASATGTKTSPFSAGGAITTLLGLVGFAATLAGGYALGARASRPVKGGLGAWPHAIAQNMDELESEYQEMGGRS